MSLLGLGRVKTLYLRGGLLAFRGKAELSGGSDRRHERLHAHDVHDAGEIVGENA